MKTNSTYLHYLLSEMEHWGWIGYHASEKHHDVTYEFAVERMLCLLTVLSVDFPEIFHDLYVFMKERMVV